MDITQGVSIPVSTFRSQDWNLWTFLSTNPMSITSPVNTIYEAVYGFNTRSTLAILTIKMPFTLSQHFSAHSPFASFPCANLVWSCAYVVCAYSILFVKQSVSWTDKITLAAATARTPPAPHRWGSLGSRVWNVHKIVAPINAAMNYARDAWSSTTTASSLCVVCVSCRVEHHHHLGSWSTWSSGCMA